MTDGDLISRQAVVDIVEFECGEWTGLAKTIVKAIEQLPSAEKTAEWIDDMSLGYHISICSNCNWRGHGDTHLIYKSKYCPNCGARMDGKESEEEE